MRIKETLKEIFTERLPAFMIFFLPSILCFKRGFMIGIIGCSITFLFLFLCVRFSLD